MNPTRHDDPPVRRPYEKPTVHQVELRPDEAVLGVCKTSSSSGPVSDTCAMPTPCSSERS
jgi:hypothetical protein